MKWAKPTRDESIKGMLEDLRNQARTKAERARAAGDKEMEVSSEVMAAFLGNALEAHAAGQYGNCTDCGKPISLLRLCQFPLDPRCAPCAEENEVSEMRKILSERLKQQMNRKTHAKLYLPV